LTKILKVLRLKYGYTQEELANTLGYRSKSGYSMLESGRVELTISKIKALSSFYGIDPKNFFEMLLQETWSWDEHNMKIIYK